METTIQGSGTPLELLEFSLQPQKSIHRALLFFLNTGDSRGNRSIE